MAEIIFSVLGLIFLLGLVIVLRWRPKKLSEKNFQTAVEHIQDTESLDPAHSIMESHKIFIAALKNLLLDKNSNAAQTTKKFAKRFQNQAQVWKFHGLRNRIAHETDIKVTENMAGEARKTFVRALESLR